MAHFFTFKNFIRHTSFFLLFMQTLMPASSIAQHSLSRSPKSQINKAEYTVAEVEIYITDWCPYCKKAIQFLRSLGISPKIYNIEKDAEARKRKDKLDSKPGVPFAIINGTPVHGFSESYYKLILDGDL